MLMPPSNTMMTTANVTINRKPSPYNDGSMQPTPSGPSRIPAASRKTMLGIRVILPIVCATIPTRSIIASTAKT